MNKQKISLTSDFFERKLVYQKSPEGPKGVESQREAPKEKEPEKIDNVFIVFNKADEKANELIASGDPKKQEIGERLKQQVEAGREDAKNYTEPQWAQEAAQRLQKTLNRIAGAGAAKEKESEITDKEAADLYAQLEESDASKLPGAEKEVTPTIPAPAGQGGPTAAAGEAQSEKEELSPEETEDIYAKLDESQKKTEDIYAGIEEKEKPEEEKKTAKRVITLPEVEISKKTEEEEEKPAGRVITLPEVEISKKTEEEAPEKPEKREAALVKEAQRYAKRYFENNPGKSEARFNIRGSEFVATNKEVGGRQVIVTRKAPAERAA